MKQILKSGIMLGALILMATNVKSQIKTPQPSPSSTIKQTFGLGEITLEYSRPVVKGRVIFGDLVPFGKVWRTGANANTKLSFTEAVSLNGKEVPAGSYSLYTIPNKDSWTIIISKNLENWGSDGYKDTEDLVRFEIKPSDLTNKAESFTIGFNNVEPTKCTMDISWDKTLVSIPVTTDIEKKVMASIESTLNPKPSAGNYYSAASYYFENGKDLTTALEYVNKSISMRPEAFWVMHLKAKIQAKQKDYKGAMESATASMAEAEKQNNADYVELNKKLISDCKKK